PQIKQVSNRIRQEINWAGDADLVTAEDLTELAVLWVLADRYLDKWRSVASAGQQQGDIWGQKAKQRVGEGDDLLRKLVARRRRQSSLAGPGRRRRVPHDRAGRRGHGPRATEVRHRPAQVRRSAGASPRLVRRVLTCRSST